MDQLVLPDVVVDFRRQEVRGRDGAHIDLRPQSFTVLRHLADNPGELVSKDDLLEACWPGVIVTEDSLTQCISDIRRALGDNGRNLIRTVARRGYRLVPPEDTASGGASPSTPMAWAKVAVLPFRVLSGKASAEGEDCGRLAADLIHDIATELARNRALTILAHETAVAARGMTPAEIFQQFHVNFILDASVRIAGRRIVVDAHLVAAGESYQFWTQRFDFSAEDLSEGRDDAVGEIAAIVCSELQRSGYAATLQRSAGTLNAFECVARGLALELRRFDRESVLESRRLFVRAQTLEPTCGLAHMALGANLAADAGMLITGEIEPDVLPDAIATIRCGIELDRTQAYGYHALAYALFLTGQHEEALATSARAVALAPGNAFFSAFLGFLRVNAGEYEAGLVLIERAIAVDSFGPAYYLDCLAKALYALNRFELASRHAAEAAARNPELTEAYVTGAAVDMARERREDAFSRIQCLLRVSPAYTMRAPSVANAFGRAPDMRARYIRHLQEAGMPA